MDEEKKDGLGRADETLVQAAEEVSAGVAAGEDADDGFATVAWPDVWPEGEADEEADADEADGEPKVALFGRDVPATRLFVAAGIAAAVLLAGIGGRAVLSRQPEPVATESRQETNQASTEEAEAKTMYVNVGVTAEGWDEATSSPVIAHIESDDGEVDFYHAYSANKAEAVAVGDESTCKVTYISPVNADGSIYKAGETKSVVTSEEKPADTTATTATLEKVEAGSVTPDDLTSIASQVTDAVKKGDSTLTGDKGSQVVSKVEGNIKNSPAATDDVKQSVEQQAGAAQEEAKKEETAAKAPTTSGGSSSSGAGSSSNSGSGSTGGGNSGSGQSSNQASQINGNQSQGSSQQGNSQGGNNTGGSSSSQHQHSWVHHDAEYTTVHHDAEYTTVHHDAVTHDVWVEGTKKYVHICNGCGADITGKEIQHANEAFDNNVFTCGAWREECIQVTQSHWETVTDKEAWDETVISKAAWDEQVQTKAAYDSCSCGATK